MAKIDPDRADRIAELNGRKAVLLSQRRQAHDTGDREQDAALQAQITELDKQIEERPQPRSAPR